MPAWLRTLFGRRPNQPIRNASRRRVRLGIELLEDRLTLSSYTWNAGTGNLSISLGTNESLTIVAPGGTRSFTLQAAATFTQAGGGTATGTGTNAITFAAGDNISNSITVNNTGAGVGVNNVAFAGGTIASATVTINCSAVGTTSGIDFSTATTTFGTLGVDVVNLASNGAGISDSSGSINTSTNGVSLTLSAVGQTIVLDSASNNFGSAAGAVIVTSASNLTIDDDDAIGFGAVTTTGLANIDTGGFVNFTGATTVGGNLVVNTDANGGTGADITDTGAAGILSITGSTALVSGTASVTLDNAANNFGGAVRVNAAADVTIDDVGAISFAGVSTTGDLVVDAAGAVTFTGSATIGGAFDVDATANGGTGGAITDTGSGNVSVAGLAALVSGNQAITLDSTTNDFTSVTIGASGAARLVDVNSITLTAATLTSSLDVTATSIGVSGAVSAQDSVVLSANDMAIGSTITTVGAGGFVILQNLTASRAISLGMETAGQLSLTNAELDRLSTTTLFIGSSSAGSITVSAAIDLIGDANVLSLTTGAAIVDGNATGNDLTVAGLAMNAVTGIGSSNTLETTVSNLEAQTGTGGVGISNTGNLTIGGVGALAGLQATISGAITISTTGTLTVSEAVSTASGSVNLTGDTTLTVAAVVRAATGTFTASGLEDINLDADISAVTITSDAINVNVLSNCDGIMTICAQIQDGIDLVASGGTVTVAAGTYHENLFITKAMTLDGVGAVTTDVVIDPILGNGITVSGANADNVTIRDLRVTGAVDGINASNVDHLTITNVQADLNADDGFDLSTITGLVTLSSIVASSNGDDGLVGASLNTAGTVTIQNSTFAFNSVITSTGDGVQLTNVGVVVLTSIAASGNDVGVLVAGAASFSDTDGVFTDNDDHGIQLIDIAGDVSLADLTITGNTSGGQISNVANLNFRGTTGTVADAITASGTSLQHTRDPLGANVVNQALTLTNITNLSLAGDGGVDAFNVTPAIGTTINVDGDLPTPPASPGDTLNVNTAGTTNPLLTISSSATGRAGYTFGNRQPVNFQEIEDLVGVNDPPTCTIGPPQNTTDESGPQSVPGWIIDCSPVEPGQTIVMISVTVDMPELFTTPGAVDMNGTLTYDPAPNVQGTATVTVTVKDDGGTANGGVDSSSTTRAFVVAKPHAWHNATKPLDVVGSGSIAPDGHIAAGDALAIINYINAFGAGAVPANAAMGQPFGLLDTASSVVGEAADNSVAPNDALAVINAINAGQGGEGESKADKSRISRSAPADQPPATNGQPSLNELIELLASDVAVQQKRRTV